MARSDEAHPLREKSENTITRHCYNSGQTPSLQGDQPPNDDIDKSTDATLPRRCSATVRVRIRYQDQEGDGQGNVLCRADLGCELRDRDGGEASESGLRLSNNNIGCTLVMGYLFLTAKLCAHITRHRANSTACGNTRK